MKRKLELIALAGLLSLAIGCAIYRNEPVDSNQPQVAGWRTSNYGIENPTAVVQSNSAYYIEVAKGMALKFPDSRPGGIYTVGYIDTGLTTAMPSQLQSTLGTMNGVRYDLAGVQADPEVMLTAFDAAGLDIILGIEPGAADINALATKILNKYKQHPSVKGFGLDNEWYKGETGNVVMSPAEAITFRDAIKAVNPSYKVTLKHYDETRLPRNISGITYLTDTCGFSSKNEAVAEYAAWANYFSGSEVAYQFGYDAECGENPDWWKALGPAPYGYGEAALQITDSIRAATNNPIYSIYWVDFTILTQFPIDYKAGRGTNPTPTYTEEK